ncbi:SNF2 family N-terminal domain-containing protein [Cladochytrium replicatum]|nr:SNF2 family N-terminal domain-containing protein [Cladochytrium replicatum]
MADNGTSGAGGQSGHTVFHRATLGSPPAQSAVNMSSSQQDSFDQRYPQDMYDAQARSGVSGTYAYNYRDLEDGRQEISQRFSAAGNSFHLPSSGSSASSFPPHFREAYPHYQQQQQQQRSLPPLFARGYPDQYPTSNSNINSGPLSVDFQQRQFADGALLQEKSIHNRFPPGREREEFLRAGPQQELNHGQPLQNSNGAGSKDGISIAGLLNNGEATPSPVQQAATTPGIGTAPPSNQQQQPLSPERAHPRRLSSLQQQQLQHSRSPYDYDASRYEEDWSGSHGPVPPRIPTGYEPRLYSGNGYDDRIYLDSHPQNRGIDSGRGLPPDARGHGYYEYVHPQSHHNQYGQHPYHHPHNHPTFSGGPGPPHSSHAHPYSNAPGYNGFPHSRKRGREADDNLSSDDDVDADGNQWNAGSLSDIEADGDLEEGLTAEERRRVDQELLDFMVRLHQRNGKILRAYDRQNKKRSEKIYSKLLKRLESRVEKLKNGAVVVAASSAKKSSEGPSIILRPPGKRKSAIGPATVTVSEVRPERTLRSKGKEIKEEINDEMAKGAGVAEQDDEERRKQIWLQIARKAVPKAQKLLLQSTQTRTANLRKISVLAVRETRRVAAKNIRGVRELPSRARRMMREMLIFWKRNEKDERENRKRAEKEAQEKRRIEEELRDAKRQARKLNFLITQTELYSHFVGKKIGGEDGGDSSGAGPSAGGTSASGPTGGNFKEIDFDQENDESLEVLARQSAEEALRLHRERTRAFDDGTKVLRAEGEAEGSGGASAAMESMDFMNPTTFEGGVETEQPKMLTCKLKAYQLKGLNWLANLYEQGINGILADEMGLGKTVQSISLLAYLAETHNIWGPFIVITPASTLHNWQQEVARFVPQLRALPYWGKDRKILRKYWNKKKLYTPDAPFHVLITSYQLVVSDEKYFSRIRWQYMILDEAQAIKSSTSARWKTLLGFNCRNRLLLTGTPIQNTMQELWALLHFIMPSFFDSHEEFSEWFSKDIESHAENGDTQLNEHQLRRLHMILKPFMLRRVKKDVENELGEKIEIEVPCQLTARQKQIYQLLKEKISVAELIGRLDQAGTVESLMNIVMQFRKVCNHPELFDRADVQGPVSFVERIGRGKAMMSGGVSMGIPIGGGEEDEDKMLAVEGGKSTKGKGSGGGGEGQGGSGGGGGGGAGATIVSGGAESGDVVGYSVESALVYRLPRLIYWDAVRGAREGRKQKFKRVSGGSTMRNAVSFVTDVDGRGYVDLVGRMFFLFAGMRMYEARMKGDGFGYLTGGGVDGCSAGEVEMIARGGIVRKCMEAFRVQEGWTRLRTYCKDNAISRPAIEEITCIAPLAGRVVDRLWCNVVEQDETVESLRMLPVCFTPKVIAPPVRYECASNAFNSDQFRILFHRYTSDLLYGALSRNFVPASTRTLQRQQDDVALVDSGCGHLLPSRKEGWSFLFAPSVRTLVTDSGKMLVLEKLLTKLKSEGHRVLIYFQMTRMIDLMEEYLSYKQYLYLRLDGSTAISDRRDMVTDWQTRPDIFIFLLSTRAGGLGINLTAADTVIFYDSDWNPTVDQQAMDRAHRLGQTKQVTVYRLITVGTIEERIVERAKQKDQIQKVVISGGEFRQVDFKSKEVLSLLLDDDELTEKLRQQEAKRKVDEEIKAAKQKKSGGGSKKKKKKEPAPGTAAAAAAGARGVVDDAASVDSSSVASSSVAGATAKPSAPKKRSHKKGAGVLGLTIGGAPAAKS